MAITQLEKGIFLSLFNRGGYVLDFSTNDFDNFTLMSVGVALCERYQLSKGKSLTAYLDDCADGDALKLLNDLLEYYELHYEDEYVKPDVSEKRPYSHIRYSAEYARYYRKARAVIDREIAEHNPFEGASEYLKEQFSSEYMTAQINSLMELRTTNPTDAIGKAKELVESCCRTILKETGVKVPSSWGMNELIKETKRRLDIDTESVSSDLPEAQTVKKILGSLTGLVGGIAEYRNSWGSGHGKAADFEPLFVRHAKLAVGSSVTLVEYLWDTYLWRKEKGHLR
ncbi:abortive infection family protein [Olsenella sp. An293]|uniref:abortive infection family protein n=1 Tax=Olsenella sp. An293 TaxID=1965626 RepID=UPI00194DB885|nr:abortive infection family protein [Olsenella sp. An293]